MAKYVLKKVLKMYKNTEYIVILSNNSHLLLNKINHFVPAGGALTF